MASIDIDPELIRQLAALLDEGDLTELEIEQGDSRIRVARQPAPVTASAAPAAAAVVAAPSAAAAAPASGGSADPAQHPGAVKSPMVGTIYLAPEPGAATFVSEGDSVREGQTLLIVEAMKVMNPIASPKSGRVARVLVENGSPVEYGEPLMIIE